MLEKIPIDMPFMAGAKDLQHRLIWATEIVANVLGFKHLNEVLNKQDADIFDDALTQQFWENDKKAFRGETFIGLEMTRWHSIGDVALLAKKSPLYDENQNIIGTFANVVTVYDKKHLAYINDVVGNLKNIFGQRTPINLSIQNYSDDNNLSARQNQVLYYTLQGMTSKMIARKLSVSSKTIEYHLSVLKIKLDCSSKAQLIEKSIALGYLSIVPKTLFERDH
jgi:DNA-binding CsgD family transcriptional regulator